MASLLTCCSPMAPPRRLLQAASEGNLPLFINIAKMLDAGRGRLREAVEAVRDRGAGALHLATISGNMWLCIFLVEELRVDVNTVDDSGETPLAYAVRVGGVDTVRYLLHHDANPHKRDNKGYTPLHLAAAQGKCEIVKALLLKGANVHSLCVVGTQGQLHRSIDRKLQDGIMKEFWWYISKCNKFMNIVHTPLTMAIAAGWLECVELLIKAGADVKGIGTTAPLIIAATNGFTDSYRCLLEAGANPDVRDDFGHLPIEIAAYNSNWKDVEILLPVTSPVPYVHDWSIEGLTSYAKSVPPLVEDYIICRLEPIDLKMVGDMAYNQNDHVIAIKCYSMALLYFPDDATLYTNKTLCWLKLRRGVSEPQYIGVTNHSDSGLARQNDHRIEISAFQLQQAIAAQAPQYRMW